MEPQSPEARIVRIEERMDRHKSELDSVKERLTEQHGDMKAIAVRLDVLNETISRGQWIIIGAVGFFMLQSMGLGEFIKKMLL